MEASKFLKRLGASILVLVGVVISGFGFMGDFFYVFTLFTTKAGGYMGLLFIAGVYTSMLLAGVVLVFTGIRFWKKT